MQLSLQVQAKHKKYLVSEFLLHHNIHQFLIMIILIT